MQDRVLYLPVLLGAIVSAVPIVYLIFGSVWSSSPGFPGVLTLQNYVSVFSSPGTYSTILNSIEYSIGASLFSIALASVLALIVQRTDAPLRRVTSFSLLIVLALPWMIEDISWTYLLSPKIGLYNLLISRLFGVGTSTFNVFSIWGMIWVMGLSLTPLSYLIISSALNGIDTRLDETSAISGSIFARTILKIDLPLALPAILSSFLLSFVIANEAFDTAAIIGIPGKVFVLTSSIYYAVEGTFPPNYGLASAYAVILVLITVVAIYLYSRFTTISQRYATVRGNSGNRKPFKLGRWRWPATLVLLVYFLGYPVPVIATLTFASFHSFWNPLSLPPPSLSNYAAFLSYPSVSTGALNSVIVSFTTAAATLFLAFFVVYTSVRKGGLGGRLGEIATSLPLAFPTIVLGVGMLWALVGSPIPLYGTIWAITLAYTIRYVPIVTRFLSGSMVQIHKELEEVSRICGGGISVTLRQIVYPLLKPALVAAGVYVLIVSMKDLGAAIILVSPGSVLLSSAIFELWYSGGSNVLVATAGGVLFVLALTIALIIAIRLLKLNPANILEAETKRENPIRSGS